MSKLIQLLNAAFPILVTPLPMMIEVKPLQPEKALPPMLVTLLGISMEVNFSQPHKAYFPMLVTFSPRTYLVT
jgi:hypothetical protein